MIEDDGRIAAEVWEPDIDLPQPCNVMNFALLRSPMILVVDEDN